MPTIENARLMLRREDVARGRMGPILADFLVEHLPFLQDDHLGIMDTVGVLLRSGCLVQAGRATIWNRGKRCNSHYVAFLEGAPAHLPSPDGISDTVAGSPPGAGSLASVLGEALSARGRLFAEAALEILTHPETQEVVSRTLNAIGIYYRPGGAAEAIEAEAQRLRVDDPERAEAIEAILALAVVDESLTAPVFARSTAIGSLMRRRIEPYVAPLRARLGTLLATPAP
jgi:hypothetical protein